MADWEKVTGHLRDCLAASRHDNTWVFVMKDVVEDALAIMEQQEPVWPTFDQSTGFYTCGSCGKTLIGWSDVNYCQKCGRKVRWWNERG